MDDFKDLIAKYGLSVILMIILMVIGVALYLWKKDEDDKDAKMIGTAGIAVAITGGFIGLGTIGYQALQKKDNGNGNNNNAGGGGGDTDADDAFPDSGGG